MLGQRKLAILAFLTLTASVAVNARLQPTSIMKITKEDLLLAETKAMVEMKGVEKEVDSIYEDEKSLDLLQQLIMMPKDDYDCIPSGDVCAGGGPPEQCCSGACVPHPTLRVFVCA